MRWTSEAHHLPAIQTTDKLLWHLQPQAAVYREGRLLSWLHLNLLWPSNPVGRALCEKSDLVVPFRQNRGSMVPVQVLYHLRWIPKAHHLPAIQRVDQVLRHLQPHSSRNVRSMIFPPRSGSYKQEQNYKEHYPFTL